MIVGWWCGGMVGWWDGGMVCVALEVCEAVDAARAVRGSVCEIGCIHTDGIWGAYMGGVAFPDQEGEVVGQPHTLAHAHTHTRISQRAWSRVPHPRLGGGDVNHTRARAHGFRTAPTPRPPHVHPAPTTRAHHSPLPPRSDLRGSPQFPGKSWRSRPPRPSPRARALRWCTTLHS